MDFAAYELMKEMPDCKVGVFEERDIPLEKRNVRLTAKDKKLYQLKRCLIMDLAAQAHFLMENIILPMILAERCTSISARVKQLN